MLPLAGILDEGGKGLLKSMRSWCPECLEVQQEEYGFCYEPLLWSLKGADICQVHNKPLATSCPRCSRRQPAISSITPIGMCEYCAHRLCVPSCKTSDEDQQVSKKQLWITVQLGRLIKLMVVNKGQLNMGNLSDTLRGYIDLHMQGSISELERFVGFGARTIGQWMRGRYKPRLDMLMTLCYRLGVDPITFLFQEPVKQLRRMWPDEAEGVYKTTREQYKEYDMREIQKQITKLSEIEPPIPLCETARRIGVRRPYLSYRFPEIAKRISARYRDYQKHLSADRTRKLHEKVRGVVRKLHESGQYPGHNVVLKLCRPCGRVEFNNFWNEEMRQIGYFTAG